MSTKQRLPSGFFGNLMAAFFAFLPSEFPHEKQKADVKHQRNARICWVYRLIYDFQDQRLQPLGHLSKVKNQRKPL